TDLDRILHRDDDLYDFKGARDEAQRVQRPGSAADALEWFAGGGPANDAETKAGGDDAAGSKAPAPPTAKAADAPGAASAGGRAAAQPEAGAPAHTPGAPRTEDEYRVYARAIVDESTNGDALDRWFHSDEQRKLRNTAGVMREVFELVDGWVKDKCAELKK